jgi:hypothetical protein
LTSPSAKASGGARQIATAPIKKYTKAMTPGLLFTVEVKARRRLGIQQ